MPFTLRFPRHAGPVHLRRLRPDDLAGFHAYRQDPEVSRFQGWVPMTEAQALAFITGMQGAPLFVPGVWAQLAIARADDDRLVGDLGLVVHDDGQAGELGFSVAPNCQGSGYASAAAGAAVDLLFEASAIQRVIGVTDARNTASIRVLERIGMQRVGQQDLVFKGEACTEWVYAKAR